MRLLPGTLGEKESLKDESFSQDLLEFPQYTRPRIWKNLKIPEELQSGNHKLISEWRMKNSLKLTQKIRPDLLKKYAKRYNKTGVMRGENKRVKKRTKPRDRRL